MKSICRTMALILALTVLAGCHKRPEGNMVDLALVNGKVWTGTAARPWAEAMAVRGEKIYAVGTTAEMSELASVRARSSSTSAGRWSCPASSTATPISWPAASP